MSAIFGGVLALTALPAAADPLYQFISNNTTYDYGTTSVPTPYGESFGEVTTTTRTVGHAPAGQLNWGFDPTPYPGYVDTGSMGANELYFGAVSSPGLLPVTHGNQYTGYNFVDAASPSLTFNIPSQTLLTLKGIGSVTGGGASPLTGLGPTQTTSAVFDPGTYTFSATSDPAGSNFISYLTFAPPPASTPEPTALATTAVVVAGLVARRRRGGAAVGSAG